MNASLNIKFGLNRTFHVLKTPVTDLTCMGGTRPCGPMMIIFDSDLYGRYQTLWTDDDNFWKSYLALVYKPKY